jgi:hypothetical protein
MKILVDSTDDRLFLIYQGGLQMMSDVSFVLSILTNSCHLQGWL